MMGTTPFYFADATVSELSSGHHPRHVTGQGSSMWRRLRSRTARSAARVR